ncbi:hypothetical protein [Mesobacillus jeotgali]|nr:hypothetical protein [Mesobacillus jeotgali]
MKLISEEIPFFLEDTPPAEFKLTGTGQVGQIATLKYRQKINGAGYCPAP